MSAEHRKPVVAFVALAIIAAALVGMQRADARGGDILAAVIGAGAHVEGTLPESVEVLDDSVALPFGSALQVLADAPAEAPGETASGQPAGEAGTTNASDAPGAGKSAASRATARGPSGKTTTQRASSTRASVRSTRPGQRPARLRAASNTLRAATAYPVSATLARSTTSRISRAPHARAAHAKRAVERPRRAVAPGKRWRSEHRRGAHRPARHAKRHRGPRR